MGLFSYFRRRWTYSRGATAKTGSTKGTATTPSREYPPLEKVLPEWITGELYGYKCINCGGGLCYLGADGTYHLSENVEFLGEIRQVAMDMTTMIIHEYRCPQCTKTLPLRVGARHFPVSVTCDVIPASDVATVFFNPDSMAQEALRFYGYDWLTKIPEKFPYTIGKKNIRYFHRSQTGDLFLSETPNA